jgi:hypothetical protein
MDKNSTTDTVPLLSSEAWFDPLEAELRERVRGFLEEMIEQEVTMALGRSRYQRGSGSGYRNGTRTRRLLDHLAQSRSRFLGPDWLLRTGLAENGRAPCCPATRG